ncbi:unnamed protein product [Zymoseptoria tritici ST99CH_3D1]|nr:unnamed protein product [Zymoseptoria tritici ST99CH_3D1]
MLLLSFFFLPVVSGATPAMFRPAAYSEAIRRMAGQDAFLYSNASNAVVDLGYAVYQGSHNSSLNITAFKGIRYAEPPTGRLRWQAPQPPRVNRTKTLPALEYAQQCPQSNRRMAEFQVTNQTGASEDCLFLNVWAPTSATAGALPVFLWIHGGGYGEADSEPADMSYLINTNENAFIAVSIAYRLGAFGFLSSDEVHRKGVVNAGLLDQQLALVWLKQYIHLFGGDPDRITIGGLSAGGGSAMLHGMAYGGSLGDQLFSNLFAASPYLPAQYRYNDWVPTQAYFAFAAQLGCDSRQPVGMAAPIFECLIGQSTQALINASATVSQSGVPGEWAFAPVTDGAFVQDTPTGHLGRRKMNGRNLLVGNNAEEGHDYTPQNIETESDLIDYLHLSFPMFSENDIAKVLHYYPSSNASVDPHAQLFATNGDSGPTAINQSALATGQQQRANNIHAEAVFICPTYWMAEAYSPNGGETFEYQFSVPPAVHAADASAYFSPLDAPPYRPSLRLAFQKILGNFIVNSNPSISGADYTNRNPNAGPVHPAGSWPPYSIAEPYQLDINTTCGMGKTQNPFFPELEVCSGSGTYNDFRLVNAYTWEGGRGTRCDFWRAMGDIVPC